MPSAGTATPSSSVAAPAPPQADYYRFLDSISELSVASLAGISKGSRSDDGLKESGWFSAAQERIAAREYRVSKDKSGHYQAPNRAQNLRARFTSEGITLSKRDTSNGSSAAEALKLLDGAKGTARSDNFSVALNFSHMGRQSRGTERLKQVVEARVSANNGRAELRRGSVTEWYENRPEGIEQGFTIHTRPSGSGSVVLAQEVAGATVLLGGKTSAVFKGAKNKKTLFNYGGLVVKDASGRVLSSHLETRRGHLRIVYSDKGATYPVVVDPLITTPAAILEKDQAGANLGVSVSGAGDVNGDGYSDVIVGAHKYDNGHTDEGAAFVYHGSASGISATPSATVEGNQADAWFGGTVSGAGDVNGDGYSDVIVGAYYYDNGQADEGAAFVYHGSASGISTTPAAMVESNQASAWMGMAVSSAGDVNGDGYSDVIVGATQYDNGHADEGAAFVYHGSASGISTTPAAMVESNQASAFFGRSASGAGDVNGDGYSDVVVGANYYDNGQDLEGAAFVYHGSASGISTTPAAIVESNQIGGRLGIASSSAGDVNGDGYSDVIVGAYIYDNGQANEGAAFIYHGSATGISTTAAAILESNQAEAQLGISVGHAGDVNGDGYADVIVGAWMYDNGQADEGAAFVYHGSPSGISTTAAAMVESNQAGAWMGYSSISGAGDINGDGFSDVIAGAFNYDNGQADEGAAFVYHGSAAGISTTAASLLESNQATAYLGYSVAAAGDVNGDGYSDVIVGAFQYDNGQSNEGAAFVYHGSVTGISTTPAATLERNQADANVGLSVASAGDVNGDGYSDVIVGAYQYDNGQAGEGAAFLYYGSSTGVSTTPAATIERNQADAFLGISVSSAGDVNGDGYSDVMVGAHKFDNGETDEGSVFVYHGSASGIPATPDTTIESNQADAIMGVSAASAGDVNGDGYSDVIVGSHFYDSGQSNEGKAFVYHGSASGLSTTPAASVESNQADANMARSVSTAGDVNGDGYSDVIVAAYLYDNGQSNEGLFFVYHGSASGISTTPAATVESNQATAYLGTSVSGAGDVNGDGYSDVIVGAYAYDNGQLDEGAAFIYHGSASGISTTSAAALERNQIGGYVGCAVADAGDVNGDGYSDVIVGAYGYDNGQSDEGAAFVYHGNGSGKPVLPRQRRGDDSALITVGLATDATGDARIKLIGRTPFGRSKVKLEWEVKPFGTAFNGAGTERSASWTDTGTADVTLNEPLSGLLGNTAYHWRARVLYHPVTGVLQPAGRWVSPPGNAPSEIDFRTPASSDTTDPVTTLSTSPITADGDSDWFKTAPTTTLTSDESGYSGYRWDGATTNTSYSSPFLYDQGEGTHTLYYQSTDDAGNTEDAQSRLFKVDTVEPANPALSSSSHTIGQYSSEDAISITFGASNDATSGVSGFSYTFDTSAESTPDTTVDAGATSATSSALPDGNSYYFHIRTKDAAGNWSAASHSGPYYINTDPPTSPSQVWSHVSSPTQVDLYWSAASDDLAIALYEVYDDVGTVLGSSTGTSLQLSGLTPGDTYRYRVKAVDEAGNKSGYTSTVVVKTSYSGETAAGAGTSAATVAPSEDISVTFDDVTADGSTTAGEIASPGAAPNGFNFRGPVFDISTTAGIGGDITLGFAYSESGIADESSLVLFHYESGAWSDVTLFVDTENNIVFGRTTSLSPFVVGSPSTGGGWWKESTADPLGSAEWQSQVGNSTYGSPHGGFSTTSNLCKTCHAVHNSMPSSFRLLKNSSRSEECNYCHMGVSGLSKYRLYAFEDLGVPIKGEHSLGSTEVPDSTLIGQSSNRSVSADAETGELMSRGGPYDDNGRQQLYCYSCHSVHGANTITDALAGGWTRRILRINPGGAPGGFNANDGLNVVNATALGFSGLVRNDNTSSDSRALTPVKTLSTIRGVFCGSCHNRNFNFRENEDDGHDYSLQRASHPMGTDGTLDAGGGAGFTGNTKVSWQNVAWCGSCHASPVEIGGATPDAGTGYAGASGTDKNSAVADTLDWGTTWYASGFPHQSSSNKLLFESYSAGARDATQTNDAQEALSNMDSVCVRCHSEDGTFNPGVSGVGSSF